MISTLIQIQEFNLKKIEKTDLRVRSVFFWLKTIGQYETFLDFWI